MSNDNPYVFISYSTKNTEIADSVKSELLKNGISCWMAPFSIPYGSNYSTEIFDAVANCKVFVLILSEQAMDSVYVSKELDLAIANCKIVIPFQIDEGKLKKNFAFYLCNVQIIHAESSVDESLKNMTEFIISVSKNLPTSENLSAHLTQRFELPSKSIVGRQHYIDQLDEMLLHNNIVCISGIGGIGKSELVRLYIKNKLDKKELEIVSYNDYKDNLKLTISLIQFEGFNDEYYLSQNPFELNGKNVTEALYKKKLSMLQHCLGNFILVIDGFDNYDDKDIDVLRTLKCKILITTRCNFQDLPQLKLDSFSETEQREVFISYYENYDEFDTEDNIYIDKILKLVDNHTLTIMLLATFLNVTGLSCRELYEELTSTTKLNLKMSDKIEYNHNYGAILQHISNLFAMSSLSEEEVNILYELSMLPTTGISKKLFRRWNKDGAMSIVDMLIKKGWIQNNRGIINLHPIINTILINHRPNSIEPIKEFLINAAEYLNVTKINGITARSEAELIAYSIADQLNDKNETVCYLLLLFGRYVDDYNYWKFYGANDTYNYTFLYQAYNSNNEFISQFEKAYSYLKCSIELYNELQLNDTGLLSRAYSNIANTCFNMNRIDEAIKYHLLALEVRTNDLGNYHEKVITTRRRLGSSYLAIGKRELALKYYKMNLNTVLEAKNNDKVIEAKCWFDCGRAYLACQNREDALTCFNKASCFIDELSIIDRFACAQICYEIAYFIMEINNEQNRKAEELLVYGKKCLEPLDSKLANSLAEKIADMLDDMKQTV